MNVSKFGRWVYWNLNMVTLVLGVVLMVIVTVLPYLVFGHGDPMVFVMSAVWGVGAGMFGAGAFHTLYAEQYENKVRVTGEQGDLRKQLDEVSSKHSQSVYALECAKAELATARKERDVLLATTAHLTDELKKRVGTRSHASRGEKNRGVKGQSAQRTQSAVR